MLTLEQAAHQQATTDFIAKQIATQSGRISFAQYMEYALYTPGLGYYCSPLTVFGKDFITAPLISSFFSRCLAKLCQQTLTNMPQAHILELGAGTGQMAADILLSLEKLHPLPASYLIFEPSAPLRQRQQETLHDLCPHLTHCIQWLEALPAANTFQGMILANEVLDALPVHIFQQQQGALLEQYVVMKDNQLSVQYDEPSPSLATALAELQKQFSFSPGYTSEICLAHTPFIHQLANSLKQGIILFIDYGYPAREYYHPDRHMGTLMNYFQHQAYADPLLHPGLQDITAHVNFTQIAEVALNASIDTLGYTTQAHFLLNSGLNDLTASCTSEESFKQNQLIKQLLLPNSMGEIVKVMALGKEYDLPLIGFEAFDLRGKL